MASLVRLTPQQAELQERARRFVDEELIPHEEAAERAGGRLPEDVVGGIVKRATAGSSRWSTNRCASTGLDAVRGIASVSVPTIPVEPEGNQ